MMKIFLTDGTGFIGQPLTKALIARGWNVLALVRKPESPEARALTKMGAQCVTGDVTDRESMRIGMTGTDVVIHNAGWYELGISRGTRTLMQSINVKGTDNVLSLALELGILRTVYVSTIAYYGDTGAEVRDETYRRQAPYRSYYEQTKSEAHEIALQYQERGLSLITICPAHVVGPNDHSPYGYFQRMYVNRWMPPFAWAPNTVHSSVHVMEVAEGIVLAVDKGKLGETYILAGESTTRRQELEYWAMQPGGFRVSFFLPFWLAALMFAPMEPVQRWLGLPASISREVVLSDKSSLSFSSAKAQRELGWTHRPARQMWSSIINEEHKLLPARKKRDLVSRLKPVEASE
jgi:dihydroflavonol-4-reductase